jgi:hypothetical protein
MVESRTHLSIAFNGAGECEPVHIGATTSEPPAAIAIPSIARARAIGLIKAVVIQIPAAVSKPHQL